MRPSLCAVSLLLAACQPDSSLSLSQRQAAIIDGQETPAALHPLIHAHEQSAPIALLYGSAQNQGCSGTLIGDRLVLTASHCLVLNRSEWADGAAPELIDASLVHIGVGPDVSTPECVFGASKTMIHPKAEPLATGTILHDVGLVVLKDSAKEACPEAIPVMPNLEILREEQVVGQTVVMAGYGAHGVADDLSSERLWAGLEIVAMEQDALAAEGIGAGFPTFGDSGGGLLMRFPDGSLRVIGVVSAGSRTREFFARTDAQRDWLDKQLSPEWLCGSVTEECRGEVVVRCGIDGFTSEDCALSGLRCVARGRQAQCEAEAPDAAPLSPDAALPDAEVDAADPILPDATVEADAADPSSADATRADAAATDDTGADDTDAACQATPGVPAKAPWLALLLVALLRRRRARS